MAESKRDIRHIVREFRKGLLGGRESHQMCFAVCSALHAYLSFVGIETELIEADFGYTNHFWLVLPDGTIIDPTADQFGLPSVYMGPVPPKYVKLMSNKRSASQDVRAGEP